MADTGLGRSYWLMLVSQGVSQLGDRVHQVALAWWTLHTTGSLGLCGAVLVAGTLPGVLFGPVAGVVADRFDKRTVMVTSDVGRGILCCILALMLSSGFTGIGWVVGIATLLATLGAFFTPANQASLPALVPAEKLLQGNAWLGSVTHFSSLVGPAIGGVVVAAWGSETAFLVNGASFLFSGLALFGLQRLPASPDVSRERFWLSMHGGMAVLRQDALVRRLLLLFAAVNLFTMPVMLWLPYFAMTVFKVGAKGLGLLEAALAAGMLVAAVGWARVRGATRPIPWIAGGLSGTGLAIAQMGFAPSYTGDLLALLVAGLAMGTVNVRVMVLFQTRIPQAELGRFMGLLGSICSALVPLSYAVYGWLSGIWNPATLLAGNGLVVMGLGLIGYLSLTRAPANGHIAPDNGWPSVRH